MGFRIQKRKSLGKGASMNLSKSGASVSKKVAGVTVNSRGKGSVRVAKGVSYRLGKKG